MIQKRSILDSLQYVQLCETLTIIDIAYFFFFYINPINRKNYYNYS